MICLSISDCFQLRRSSHIPSSIYCVYRAISWADEALATQIHSILIKCEMKAEKRSPRSKIIYGGKVSMI